MHNILLIDQKRNRLRGHVRKQTAFQWTKGLLTAVLEKIIDQANGCPYTGRLSMCDCMKLRRYIFVDGVQVSESCTCTLLHSNWQRQTSALNNIQGAS